MLKELQTAALGMLAQQTRLEVNANNLANVNTEGFKRQTVFERRMIEAEQTLRNVAGSPQQSDPMSVTFTDYGSGSINKTDAPLDVAIDGKGFFVVHDDSQNSFYTRNGKFSINEAGILITSGGKKVSDGNGGDIRIVKGSSGGMTNSRTENSVVITANGDVVVDDNRVGSLKIVLIENPQTLLQKGGSVFEASNETKMETLSAEQVMLRQGWIEGSNVSLVNEMVDMIKIQRTFEAGQKVIHTNDSTLEKSIDIGRI